MEKINLTSVIIVLTLLGFLAGCSKKDDPSPADVTKNQLVNGTWKIKTAKIDGVDVTVDFTSMTLQFTATNFTTSAGGVVWPSSGTWLFTDSKATAFKRSDDVTVMIESITNSGLTLSFTWNKTTYSGGRFESVSGKYVFEFAK